jgi:hypothetical protein
MREERPGAGRAKLCATLPGRHKEGESRQLILAGAALAAGLCLFGGTALAQNDWLPVLQESEQRTRNDPIVITLPGGLDPAVLNALSLELDDLDVTAFVEVSSGSLVLAPPEALSAGSHSLRLIERGADGSILERGYWVLEVRHSELLRELSITADLAGEINARVADKGLDTPSEHITGESGGNVGARAADGNWRVTAQGNYLYNSQLELGLDERNFDIGEYRIDGDFENEDFFTGLTVGDHDTGIDNLLMSGFYRRGVSLRAGLADERLTVTGFVQRTEPIIGTRHVVGISHEEDRVEGASVSIRPIEALRDNIVLTGTFYTGEGSDGGYGVGSDQVFYDGSGWSVTADTLWFDEALRLRGEFAQTEFDFDGKDEGFGAETANAYSLLAAVEPLRGSTLDGSTFTWTIGAEREEIDTFFQSLANPTLQPDRETTSVYTDFYWDEFAAQLRVDHQLSNVDDLDYLPTDRNFNIYFNGSYTPYVELEEDGSLPWFGQPFFSINAGLYEIDRVDRSDLFPDDDANNSTKSLVLSAGSNYETWSWNLSHSIYSFEDHVNLSSDLLNNSTNLSAYVLVDDWLTLSPSLQFDNAQDLDTGDDNQTIVVGLGAEVTVIPETLSASMYYNYQHQMGDGDTPDTNSFNGEVVWTIRPPAVNQLGVALALTGFVQDTNDDFSNPTANLQYQAFTALRLSLPVQY